MNNDQTTSSAKEAYYLSRVEKDFESYTQAFHSSVRIVGVINGGGAVALLTFLARLSTAEKLQPMLDIEVILSSLVVSISWLSLGLISTALAPIVMGRANHAWAKHNLMASETLYQGDSRETDMKRFYRFGSIATRMAYLLVAVGLLSFVLGVTYGLRSFYV